MADGTMPVTALEAVPEPIPASPAGPAPAAAPPAPEPVAPTTDQDIEDLELAAFREAAAKETVPAAVPPAGAPAVPEPGAAPAADDPAPPPAAETPPAPGVMIPKARFDEVLDRERQAAEQAAYWRGVAEGRTAAPAASPAPAPVKTPQQRLAEIDAAKIGLAERFDNGEISAKQWKEQETGLEQEARTLLARSAAPPPAPAPDTVAASDLYLDRVTAELEDAHPYAMLIPADHWAWEGIEKEARQSLLKDGVRLGNDARSALAVRERMAALTDRYGPGITGIASPQAQAEAARRTGRQPSTTAPPAAGARPAPTGPTAQDRADKLALAARHPPDLTAARTGPNSIGDLSDAQIAQLSDEEITALPESVRRRHLPLN